jgi:large subunit ribosomal protein L4
VVVASHGAKKVLDAQGFSRVPIWRGGGITHGPTGNENYSHAMSVGDKRGALRQALSLKNTAESIIVVESLESKTGKTKDMGELFTKLGAVRNTLVVTHAADAVFARAVRNLQNIKVIRVRALNVFDVMNADKIIVTPSAVSEIAEWLGSKS